MNPENDAAETGGESVVTPPSEEQMWEEFWRVSGLRRWKGKEVAAWVNKRLLARWVARVVDEAERPKEVSARWAVDKAQEVTEVVGKEVSDAVERDLYARYTQSSWSAAWLVAGALRVEDAEFANRLRSQWEQGCDGVDVWAREFLFGNGGEQFE